MRPLSWLIALSITPAALCAQTSHPPAAPVTPAEPAPEAQQIATAVLPLPVEFRDSARVLGYRSGNAKLVTLRQGTGAFTCLATDPSAPRFHVACYHRSLEPFMARGRVLRAKGMQREQVDSVRYREVKRGSLVMPRRAAALYSLTAPEGAGPPDSTGVPAGARPLFVIYIPGQTPESTGLSAKPAEGTPWIMFPGTPKAHIMFTPRM